MTAGGARGRLPVVAVVGRPNVGKSTLVNVLSGRTASIVADIPSVTRDRVVQEARIGGRPALLIDTGGFIISPRDPVERQVMEQLRVAVGEADLVLCLFDASEPPLAMDEEIVRFVRRAGVPVLYAANKADRAGAEAAAGELYRLGPDTIDLVSAAHRRGTRALAEKIAGALAALPAGDAEAAAPPRGGAAAPRILVIGRPNAGKSTLVNRVLGTERVIVDPRPGTTRDCIEVDAEVDGAPVVLIDSAGIRRPRSIGQYLEELTVIRAIRAVERADVVVLLVDAPGGMVQQDERLVSLVLEKGRGVVVGLNKWDRMRRVSPAAWIADSTSLGEFFAFVPAVPVSGLTGWNAGELLRVAVEVAGNRGRRVSTGELNRFFEKLLAEHPPPRVRGRAVRIYYVSQTGTSPPVFSLVANAPEGVPESYTRFLAARLRERFGFAGVPLALRARRRRRDEPGRPAARRTE